MGEELQLVEGHAHLAWDTAGTGLARVWPSTELGRWWVEVLGQAIPDLVPSCEVPAALALAGFHAGKWTSWPVEAKATNPAAC